jgi:hypothetical protein
VAAAREQKRSSLRLQNGAGSFHARCKPFSLFPPLTFLSLSLSSFFSQP